MTDEEHLIKFIKKIAIEQKYDNFDVKITPVSSGGANYTSKLYQVKISEEGRDDLQLFAKEAVMSEKIRNLGDLRPYDTERIVYTDLMKTYRQLEEKQAVPEQNRLKHPKYYGVDVTHLKELLLLEDLTSRGFGSANRFKSVDWSYAAAAVMELAKFHALSMAYQHKNPSEFDKTCSLFPTGLMNQSEETNALFDHSAKSAIATVRKENKEKLERFLEDQPLATTYDRMLPALRRGVLIHVDFRPNNLLHKVNEDGTTEVIPVDYQTVQLGSPVIDLLYFIFTATDGQFRAKYYQKLVNHYYSELGAALARFGLDVKEKYSKEDFEFEMEKKLPFGLLVAVILLPILTVPEDQAPVVDKSFDIASFAIDTGTDLYSQRLNDIIDDFVKFGVL